MSVSIWEYDYPSPWWILNPKIASHAVDSRKLRKVALLFIFVPDKKKVGEI